MKLLKVKSFQVYYDFRFAFFVKFMLLYKVENFSLDLIIADTYRLGLGSTNEKNLKGLFKIILLISVYHLENFYKW